MKVRRVTLEVEVEVLWNDKASTVLAALRGGLRRWGVRNQAQVVKDEESPSKRAEWPA